MSGNNKLITHSYKMTKQTNLDSKPKNKNDAAAYTSKAANDDDLVFLKEFDLNWEYGPSMGITRLERWARAEKHGLNPSPRVKQIIEAHPGEEEYIQCLWNDYKNIV